LILKDDEARLKYDKEYKSYYNSKEQNHTSKNTDYSSKEYSFEDDVLNDWVKKAKEQAKEMVRMSIDDLVGMSKSAFGAVWDATKYHIFTLILLSFILLAISK
jgi:hypothetical protein